MTRKKVLIVVAVVLVGGAVVGANLYFKRETGVNVTAEAIRARDLEAIVSASGKDPAEAPGQHLGQHHGPGDARWPSRKASASRPASSCSRSTRGRSTAQLQRGEASVAAAQSSLQQVADRGRAGARHSSTWPGRT